VAGTTRRSIYVFAGASVWMIDAPFQHTLALVQAVVVLRDDEYGYYVSQCMPVAESPS